MYVVRFFLRTVLEGLGRSVMSNIEFDPNSAIKVEPEDSLVNKMKTADTLCATAATSGGSLSQPLGDAVQTSTVAGLVADEEIPSVDCSVVQFAVTVKAKVKKEFLLPCGTVPVAGPPTEGEGPQAGLPLAVEEPVPSTATDDVGSPHSPASSNATEADVSPSAFVAERHAGGLALEFCT
jgi:hypothetical protein